MALSLSTTTVETAISRMLSKMKITEPVDQIREKLLRQLNISQKEMQSELIKAPEIRNLYVVEAPAPATILNKIFQMSSISDYLTYDGFRQTDWGTINETDWSVLENLEKDYYARKEKYFAVYGDMAKFFIGSSLSQVTNNIFFKYVRKVKTLVAKTDLLDVPEGYEDKLMNKTIVTMGGTPPATEEQKPKE